MHKLTVYATSVNLFFDFTINVRNKQFSWLLVELYTA